MKPDWYSEDHLKQAWKYARSDARDDFIFDVIDYEDLKVNVDHIISSLNNQLKNNQYHPAPPIRISIPKNYHSTRPGTVIPLIDLTVLYAIAQQLAPLLDPLLSESAYAYRLNPKAGKKGAPLFKDRQEENPTVEDKPEILEDTVDAEEVEFPYDWFTTWKLFHEKSKEAARTYEHTAVTDIVAYFENISLDLLREIIKEKLLADNRDLIDRLFRLLEFWDWTPTGNLPQNIGLVQGNDVSSFLSNLYLIDLDDALLKIVSDDQSKYYRYIDDIKVYTSDKDEARRALVRLEEVLRRLNLNVQSAKTEIKEANEIFDPDVETWLERMAEDNADNIQHAVDFYENVFDEQNLGRWQRPYFRCLTLLRQSDDGRAIPTALSLFLDNPSHRLLAKNFTYLKHFTPYVFLGQEIGDRLSQSTYTFPYHTGFLYRLAAYSRDDGQKIKQSALELATDNAAHWFCRLGALFCLNTFPLAADELAQISNIVLTESNPNIVRAGYVTLSQHAGDEFRWMLDQLTLFNAPHQDYLRRYFFRMYRNTDLSKKQLPIVKKSSLNAPNFIINLHKMDLLKSNIDKDQRAAYKEMIEEKIAECDEDRWPRLALRLRSIYDAFILRP